VGKAGVSAEFVDHEIEVVLTVMTTHDDIEAALERSGVVEGALIGEALIQSVQVYSPEVSGDEGTA
jgi:hypothetical protein